MHALAPVPRRLPQRVVVAGAPDEKLATFLPRLATALDVPLVPLAELSGPAELARLATFDGWVTTADEEWARPPLLERADLLLHVELEAAGFAGRVRRTLRRIRSDRAPDLGWVDAAAMTHPALRVARLPDATAADAWLHSL
ncbi:hypothetical protein [Nocardioides sp. L-11A]|uniref:hypothetical protein n=1 Tax=Nocardioides sp. L-11A TaxID=3043848 RepID=UPI00249A900C|nr:hypothetical protein QJ852_08910 [Nocardioides sp. L-11A]